MPWLLLLLQLLTMLAAVAAVEVSVVARLFKNTKVEFDEEVMDITVPHCQIEGIDGGDSPLQQQEQTATDIGTHYLEQVRAALLYHLCGEKTNNGRDWLLEEGEDSLNANDIAAMKEEKGRFDPGHGCVAHFKVGFLTPPAMGHAGYGGGGGPFYVANCRNDEDIDGRTIYTDIMVTRSVSSIGRDNGNEWDGKGGEKKAEEAVAQSLSAEGEHKSTNDTK